MGLLNKDKPFIYVLDCMDALTSDEEIKKFKETEKAEGEGKTTKGSFGTAKAKKNSEILRNITRKITKTKSLLIIISQTRDNIGLGFAEKTRSGGKALRFYSDHEMWMAVVKTLRKTVHDRQRVVGMISRIKIKKNSITGKVREVDVPMRYDYGVDNIESCLDFLTVEKRANLVKTKLGLEGQKGKLIRLIEKKNYERRLSRLCGQVWNDIEESLKTNRKRRFR